jgi:predicted acetyltransferase
MRHMPRDCAAVRPLTDEDIPAALDLIRLAWPEIPRQAQEEMIRRDPWRADQRSFGAFVGEHLVSHARFHYRPVRCGSVVLDMSGVCEVTTHPDFRRRGLGHRVLRAALDWMRSVGRHFVTLYTSVNAFYAPLGWGTIDVPMHYLPLAAAPRLGRGSYRVTRLPATESGAALADIYAQSCGRRPISLIRTPEYWQQWPHWAKDNLWFGLLDNEWSVAWSEQRVVAHGGINWSLQRKGTPSIHEACALPGHEDALLDVFDDLVERSRAASEAPLELNLPGDHPLVTRLEDAGERSANTSAMIQVLDLMALLQALKPEIERRTTRLKGSARLRLTSPLGSAAMAAAPGEVAISDGDAPATVDCTAAGLASLVLGFRSAADLCDAGEITAPAEAGEALAVLFPCLHTHYWQIDHF